VCLKSEVCYFCKADWYSDCIKSEEGAVIQQDVGPELASLVLQVNNISLFFTSITWKITPVCHQIVGDDSTNECLVNKIGLTIVMYISISSSTFSVLHTSTITNKINMALASFPLI